MAFQDDIREKRLIELFRLDQPPERGRSDVDAYLEIDGQRLPFELKSTSRGGVTTVRDFGPEHIKKWQHEHWLIGVYNSEGDELRYCLYGSPAKIRPWILEKEKYIEADFALAKYAPGLLQEEHLRLILGDKKAYGLADARRLHKKQFTTAEYRAKADLNGGRYSPPRMLEIRQDRLRYVIERGSTLNNPHIPKSYFQTWERITTNYPETLRRMVRQAISESV